MNQSGTALGATWDPSLIEQAGLKIMAQDAKLRAISIVLAPTCNIQRVSRIVLVFRFTTLTQIKIESDGRESKSVFPRSDLSAHTQGVLLVELRKFFRRSLFIWHDNCLVCEWSPKRRNRDCD